jgi:hypothetical protein
MPGGFIRGSGGANLMGVTGKERAKIVGPSFSLADSESFEGKSYNLNTLETSITSGTTAMFYLKNTGDNDIVLTGLFYNLYQATASKITIDVLRNPTAGDIVTTGTAISANENKNHGSNNSLSATIYKGADQDAFTDGTIYIQSTINGSSRVALNLGAIVVPKGTSIGVQITVSANTTASVAASCYEKTQEV